jgi:hypothetical protein
MCCVKLPPPAARSNSELSGMYERVLRSDSDSRKVSHAKVLDSSLHSILTV